MNNLEWLNNKDYEPISKEEMEYLFIKLNDGDLSVKNEIAKHNMKLILHLINVHFYYYENIEELFEIGMIGLVKAINYYDVNKNYKFSTFASRCINNEILNFMRDNKKQINAISLETPIIENNDGTSVVLKEVMEDELNIQEEYDNQELYNFINSKLDILTEKQRKAIKLRFGFDNKIQATFNEIGKELNCSRTNATNIIETGLKKIKKELIKQKYIKEEELHKGYKKLY